MADDKSIVVRGWVVKLAAGVVAVALGTVAFLAWGDSRYVTRTEWQHAEGAEAREVAETSLALDRHIEQTRLDATRLGVIEVQLKTIERQLDLIGNKLDRAASKLEKAR